MSIQNKNQSDISVGDKVKLIKIPKEYETTGRPYWLPEIGTVGDVTKAGRWDALVHWDDENSWYCPVEWLEKVEEDNE